MASFFSNSGAQITAWESYTPTVTGFGTVSNVKFFWRRIGPNMVVRGSLTTGTHTGVNVTFTLPNSLQTNASILSAVFNNVIGIMGLSGNLAGGAYIVGDTSNSNTVFVSYTDATHSALTVRLGTDFGNTQNISLEFSAPIVGW